MTVRTMGRVVACVGALAFVMMFVPSANAADLPKTPQPVAEYFADGLIPRLINLYGSGNGVTTGVDFDATTKVGTISRVREWTPDYLAGHTSDDPTRLTNNWVAPVSVRDKVLGLATVWINPSTNQPELASFDNAELARQIAAAPQGSALIHDPAREAWFALVKDSLFTLVPGSSGVTGATTPGAYQRLISTLAPEEQAKPTGVAIAALVLGVVILGVAIFVLLPLKRTTPMPTDGERDDDVIASDANGVEAGGVEARGVGTLQDLAKLPAPMPVATLQPASLPPASPPKVTKEPTVELPPKTMPTSSVPAKKAPTAKAPAAKPAVTTKTTGGSKVAGGTKAASGTKVASGTMASGAAAARNAAKAGTSAKATDRPPAKKKPASTPKIVVPSVDSSSKVNEAGD